MVAKRNWMPAGHFYLARCDDCKPFWVEICDKRPLAARQRAYKHAKRKPGHRAYTVNVSLLEIATTHHFQPLPDLTDEPPF